MCLIIEVTLKRKGSFKTYNEVDQHFKCSQICITCQIVFNVCQKYVATRIDNSKTRFKIDKV